LYVWQRFGKPKDVVIRPREQIACGTCRLLEGDQGAEIVGAKDLFDNATSQMQIGVPNLQEQASALSQEIVARQHTLVQVREIGVDAELPGVSEGTNLLGLPGEILRLSVSDVAVARGDLPIRPELDPI